MGQRDVADLLARLRRAGDDRYFSVREIERMLRVEGHSNGVVKGTGEDLKKLKEAGQLDFYFYTYRMKKNNIHDRNI